MPLDDLATALQCTLFPVQVLVVDDDPDARGTMRRVLERQGYSVLLAASGPEALRLLHGTHLPVDLLITDVQMPVLPGDVLVQEVRRSWPELPVLYVSGEPDFANLPEATGGRSRFLRKPYGPEELLDSVLRVLTPHSESPLLDEVVDSVGPLPDQHAPSLL